MNRIPTYAEFWPFYLREHGNLLNRKLHFLGTSLALAAIIAAILTHNGWLVLVAVICGYSFAWVGHFCVEKNRPATFRYPVWSFNSDFRMWFRMITFRELN